MSVEHENLFQQNPTKSQIDIHWILSNAVIISIAVFSIIMYIYSYDIFKYILMFMVAILLTYNIGSYYSGNSFSSYTSSYSETSMWFITIIIILSLMLASSYVIMDESANNQPTVIDE
jgi:hypothetical protein